MFEVCLDYHPSVLDELEQLSLMSTANAVSVDLKTNVEARLVWLDKIISLVKKEVFLT
jgi:hypothetical protein